MEDGASAVSNPKDTDLLGGFTGRNRESKQSPRGRGLASVCTSLRCAMRLFAWQSYEAKEPQAPTNTPESRGTPGLDGWLSRGLSAKKSGC